MKKNIILIILSIISLKLIGQSDTGKTKFTNYICLATSMTNSIPVNDFKMSAYPSVENGVMYKNIGLACILGYRNFNHVCKHIDSVYYEFKTYACFPLGEFTGTLLFGWGGYFGTEYNFIEYGIGISYSVGKFGYGITYSNWDEVNYVTPSITYNF